MRWHASALLALLASAAAGCGSNNSTGPHVRGLVVAAGAGQRDTVLSTLPQAVILQLAEAGDLYGHVVQFTSVAVPSSSGFYAYVHRLDSQFPTTFVADTTSAEGRVEIEVVLGAVAGTVPIIVAVPDFGLVDTITFTATPGKAVTVSVAPKDTTIMLNGSVTLRGGLTDAYGNVLPDPVTFTVLTGPAVVSGTTVTGTAVGIASILATAGGKSDTAYVTALPTGVLAAGSPAGLRIFNIDGSGMQGVNVLVGSVRWSPSGTSLAFDQTFDGLADGSTTLYTITPTGTTTAVDVSPNYFDQWPQWSRDGATIYYSKISGPGSALWHVTPSGGGDDSVSNQHPSFDIFPSPSPDGSKLAYIADLGSTADLRILTLSSGAVTDLNIVAWAPVWGPTGQIAYLNQYASSGQIAVANADGSGQRVLSGTIYDAGFDWSPDGQYIVANNGTGLDLIVVATGATLALPNTGSFFSPSWNPSASAGALRVPSAAPRAHAIQRRRAR
jgi:Tol biopolymer transport system component